MEYRVTKINLNLDHGRLGLDAVPLVPSVTIPCCAPRTMHHLTAQAVEAGIDVGALISGLPPTADELRDDVLYQVGALDAFVRAEGGAMRHVKPYGPLYTLCGRSEEHARALLEAVAGYDDELIVIVGSGWPERVAGEYGLTVVREGSIDLEYGPDGYPRAERVEDPDDVVRRALGIVRDHAVTALDGSTVEVVTRTLCLHGDAPNVLEVIHRVRERLAEAGIEIVGLNQALTETPAAA
jgi:UPF0271 protein